MRPLDILCQDPVAFADRQQDRVQHLVDALQYFAVCATELLRPASLSEPTFAGCLDEAQDLL